jgi:hypothetical protein
MELAEKAFWTWWEKIKEHKDNYNLRNAFDAGYEAAIKDIDGESKG